MPVRRWDPGRVERAAKAEMARRMGRATLHVKGSVQRLINRGNAGGDNPSAPGEPPKKVTGRLFQSIATDVRTGSRSVIGRVGSNVEYARRLELGFVGTDSRGRVYSQAPRPYLRRALREQLRAVVRILGGK